PSKPAASQPVLKKVVKKVDGLSFSERHRLEALPGMIGKLEAEIAKLTELLSQADLFSREPAKFRKASTMMAERQASLAAAEEEWLALEERAAG
ncbi:MAG: ABC transporter C-terminal domain-containing protein, partial [Paracoccaceae bacterium]|nr:ABC transporter C-terminal domain-containing protein [Paracoccaceae bacterium]